HGLDVRPARAPARPRHPSLRRSARLPVLLLAGRRAPGQRSHSSRGGRATGCIPSQLPELQTLRRTLMRWRHEILEHFATGLTNARTEGFNNKAKLVKKRAYGYRSFRNYRLRLLNACA